MAKTYPQAELQLLCHLWQKELGLSDWDVIVLLSRQRDMESPTSQAQILVELPLRRALVKVLDPVDFSDSPWEQDHEVDLVHELLHIHFEPFAAERGNLHDIAQEQAVETLAKTLVRLRRGARKD